METETIILIITNIVVPILVAIITGYFKSKKHKKEIDLLNTEHENRMKELTKEYEHRIEILELEYNHQRDLEAQKTGNAIIENLTDKITDKILEQPATQRMLNQQTTKKFLSNKR